MSVMQYSSFSKQLTQIDMREVDERFQKATGADAGQCARAQDLYFKFLYLKKKFPDTALVPPHLADEYWHQHILFTQNYQQTCQTLLGQFLHHTPDSEGQINAAAWAETVRLYQQEFNQDLLADSATAVGGPCN